MNSPTQRTLKALRDDGAVCGIVEKWNQFAKIRQDLFGFIDIVALKGNKIIGVQCTSGAHHAEHKTKILESDKAPKWLVAGGKIELWSWSKKNVKRGGKAIVWASRVEEITAKDFKNK